MTDKTSEKLKKTIAEIIYGVFSQENYDKLVIEADKELNEIVNKIDDNFTVRLKNK